MINKRTIKNEKRDKYFNVNFLHIFYYVNIESIMYYVWFRISKGWVSSKVRWL